MKKKKVIVDVFIPCFIDQFFPETGMNMVKILEKLGCEVHYNQNQTCCGQPALNAGYVEEAREVAIKFLNDFPDPKRYIVVPSASCVGMIRNSYGRLFNQSSFVLDYKRVQRNTFEFSEFLLEVLKVEDIGATLNAKVTYHDSCSALRECEIKEGPRRLLQHVRGLELIEMNDTESCCGFGGTFSVNFDGIASGMAEQKVQHALESGAELLVSTDMSCLMHVNTYIKKQNKPIKVMHLVDVLASGMK